MADEINFLDILTLSKIEPDTVVEKFSSITNSSFFDASNILGGLKIKGLIDFTTSFPGQSVVHITDSGKALLAEANEKAKETQLDQLDQEMLLQLSRGKRTLADLSGAVNIRTRDLAIHLYKLMQQQFLSSTLKNGGVEITLTEKGFLNVRSQPVAAQVQQPAASATPGTAAPQQGATPPGAAPSQSGQPAAAGAKPGQNLDYLDKIIADRKRKRTLTIVAVVVVVVIIVVFVAINFLKL